MHEKADFLAQSQKKHAFKKRIPFLTLLAISAQYSMEIPLLDLSIEFIYNF